MDIPFRLYFFFSPRWSENDLWVAGAIVKHGRSLYEGKGVSIAAEPGNGDHNRFYVRRETCD